MPLKHPLARIRKEQGYTAKSLGETSGLGQRTIEKYEQGWSVPSVHNALILSELLGVEPLTLFPPVYTPTALKAKKAALRNPTTSHTPETAN